MIKTDQSVYLPPVEEIKTMEDVKDWMRKASGLLGINQSDIYDDLQETINKRDNQTIEGTKSFTSLKLLGNMDCNKKQMLSMCIEVRVSDPADPAVGQIWLRADLL